MFCVAGLISYIQLLTDAPRIVKIEVAFLIGHLFQSSKEAVMMLVSSGGLQVLVNFFQTDLRENMDLVMLSIESFNALALDEVGLKLPTNDMLNLLQEIGVPECLPPVICFFYQHLEMQEDEKVSRALEKAFELLEQFANAEPDIKVKLCSSVEVVQPLVELINSMTLLAMNSTLGFQTVKKIVRVLYWVSLAEETHDVRRVTCRNWSRWRCCRAWCT